MGCGRCRRAPGPMLRVSDQTPDGAMEPHPETSFPATLSRWVQEIALSIPGPARGTLAELIVGAMLAQGGPVTRAVLALTPRLGWQAYHWMLARGRFRLLGLVAALCGIIRRETCGRETCGPRRFAIIDDTLAPRCSAKAPGAALLGQGARRRVARPRRPAPPCGSTMRGSRTARPSCCAKPSSRSAPSCPAVTGRARFRS